MPHRLTPDPDGKGEHLAPGLSASVEVDGELTPGSSSGARECEVAGSSS